MKYLTRQNQLTIKSSVWLSTNSLQNEHTDAKSKHFDTTWRIAW